MPSPTFSQTYLGPISYAAGLSAQAELHAALKSKSPKMTGHVLGLEHSPGVITLGKRGRAEDDLRCTLEQLAERGLQLHKINRGGQATLHSPGQLVIYPCVHLERAGVGVRDFVHGLESCTQNFLRELGIEAVPGREEPGLYTATGKIAFFGLRVTHGITTHGLAINVANDLSLFDLIRSCGKDLESFDAVGNYREEVLSPSPTTDEHLKMLFSRWFAQFMMTFS